MVDYWWCVTISLGSGIFRVPDWLRHHKHPLEVRIWVWKAIYVSLKKVPLTVLYSFYLYLCCFGALTCKLSCRVRVWANGADSNKGCVHLAFLTYQWNAVNLIVTSFLAPNCEFRGKWNAAEGQIQVERKTAGQKKNHINQIGFNKRSWSFFFFWFFPRAGYHWDK